MHRPPSQNSVPRRRLLPNPRVGQGGFSLIEITLAIGIIAFSFVALFGLLPTGMQTFRASIDSTNDITMLQEMNAMVQVTSWSKVDELDFRRGDIYYFDEEGRRTDSAKNRSDLPEVRARRLYQVKMLIEKMYQPGDTTKSKEMKDARRVVVIIGDIAKPKSAKDFDSINTADDLAQAGEDLEIRARTFIVTRMESENG